MKGRVIALLPFFMPTLHIGGRSLGKKLYKLLSIVALQIRVGGYDNIIIH